jgi:hypothetical protein
MEHGCWPAHEHDVEFRACDHRFARLGQDAGGAYVQDWRGEIIRDRRRARLVLQRLEPRLAEVLDWFADPGGVARRRDPHTLARAFVFRALRGDSVCGVRAATRYLLDWEREYGAPWSVASDDRRVAEQTMFKAVDRTWRQGALGRMDPFL